MGRVLFILDGEESSGEGSSEQLGLGAEQGEEQRVREWRRPGRVEQREAGGAWP